MKSEKFYNADSDQWLTKAEVIKSIINLYHEMGLNYTEENAENQIDYMVKHGFLYTEEGYQKHFKPYEN